MINQIKTVTMKQLLLTVFLFFCVIFYTQAQRGGGRRIPQNQNRQTGVEAETKVLKASELAGVLYYDVKKVLKKIKVKDDAIKLKITNAIKKYNDSVKKIAFLNSDKFKGVDVLMKTINIANNNNSKNRIDLRKKIGETIRPIRNEIKENEVLLNKNLRVFLSEKQNKKWLKFQKKQKDKINPKRSVRTNNRQQSRNQNRQRRF